MDQGGAVDIIKRSGRRPTESFNSEKLRASIEAACLSAGTAPGQAESIARSIMKEVDEWLKTRPEVTSHDLRRVAARHLKNHHPDAAYLYEQHRITL
ncbi:MAG: ATP cone domain-containing protein [Candidatus Microsaccharimonas sp.]